MKKLLILIASLMMLVLVGCGSSSDDSAVVVVTTPEEPTSILTAYEKTKMLAAANDVRVNGDAIVSESLTHTGTVETIRGFEINFIGVTNGEHYQVELIKNESNKFEINTYNLSTNPVTRYYNLSAVRNTVDELTNLISKKDMFDAYAYEMIKNAIASRFQNEAGVDRVKIYKYNTYDQLVVAENTGNYDKLIVKVIYLDSSELTYNITKMVAINGYTIKIVNKTYGANEDELSLGNYKQSLVGVLEYIGITMKSNAKPNVAYKDAKKMSIYKK